MTSLEPAPEATTPPRSPEKVVGPLERGLSVLRAMSAPGEHRLRPSDLVHTTGLARATVDRVIGTLLHLGYLRPAGRDVELTPRLLEFGNAYLAGCRVPDALGPIAEQLAGEFDESVSLAVPDLTDVRFVTRVSGSRSLSLAFRVGDLLPAERCAAGALFARDWTEQQWRAWRERRREDPRDTTFPAVPPRSADRDPGGDFPQRVRHATTTDWSTDDQLIAPGLIAVAVPVAGPEGKTACAVSVVSHTSRHTVRSLAAATLPRLQAQAAVAERILAAGPPARGDLSPISPPADTVHAAKEELGAGFLTSLARGLTVLAALGTAVGGLTLSEVAEVTGLPRATARRSLLSLAQLGYVEVHGRHFQLLPRVLELGYAHLSGLGFTDLVQPHLRRLVDEVRESASVAVLDGIDIRYVARIPTHQIMSVDITLGTRFPAYATSLGRVLLAGLDEPERNARLDRTELRPLTRHTITDRVRLARLLHETAAAGYSLVDEELEEGLRSLAVPLRDATGAVVAAVNLATHTGQWPVTQTRAALLPALRRAASDIEADLRTASVRRPLWPAAPGQPDGA